VHKTRFTVFITVWRRPELLPRALLSLLNQGYAAWDCTIVSDGPAPNALALARQFGESFRDDRLSHIAFFQLDRRAGLWGNHLRRWAIENCRNPYCVILSHDCELLPNCLTTHALQIAGQPARLSLVGTHMWNNRVMGDPTVTLPRPEYLGVWPRGEDPKALAIADVDLTGMALPVPLALEADCFSEADQPRYAADYLAYTRLVKAGAEVVLDRTPCAAHF
jgi:glycosyltransferase involved in cell wall biosynthesis